MLYPAEQLAVRVDMNHLVQGAQQVLRHVFHVFVTEGEDPDGGQYAEQAFAGFKQRDAAKTKMSDEETFRVVLHEQAGNFYFPPASLLYLKGRGFSRAGELIREFGASAREVSFQTFYQNYKFPYLADLNAENTAPWGSARIAQVPTPSMDWGGINVFPPNCLAWVTAASTSATMM